MTHKAGGDQTDAELDDWWVNVRGLDPAKVLLGTYWVPRPDRGLNPVSEVDKWVTIVDARCPGWRNREFIFQIDAEIWNGDSSTAPSASYVRTMCQRVVELFPKLRPIVYASKGQYGDKLKGIGFPLWNANYPSSAEIGFKALYDRAGGDSGPGWRTYSGQMPAIWQFGSSATIGGYTTCDANAFRGTLSELKALVAPGWATSNNVEDDMPLTQPDADLIVDTLMARHMITGTGANANDRGTYNGAWATGFDRTGVISNVQLPAIANALASVLANVQADDGDRQALLDAISAAEKDAVATVLAQLGSMDLQSAAAAIRAALGADKAADLGALLKS